MGRAGYALGRGLDAALVVGDGKTPTAMAEGAQIPAEKVEVSMLKKIIRSIRKVNSSRTLITPFLRSVLCVQLYFGSAATLRNGSVPEKLDSAYIRRT